MTDTQEALAQIRAVYDDGEAEINGRVYTFTKVPFKEARKVFAYFTRVQRDLAKGDLWFLESQEFADVENVLLSRVLYNGDSLAKIGNHFDNYPQDYTQFVSTAMGVISFPFLPETITGSASQGDQSGNGTSNTRTSKKPM